MNQRDALKRYPRIIAHMICESLGYMSVLHAANALICHIENKPHYCEWYDHMAGGRRQRLEKQGTKLTYDEMMLRITHEVVRDAFRNRKGHRGYMASYEQAIGLVKAELERAGCTNQMLASWF